MQIVCYNIYEQTAYSRSCDFRAEFLFEDNETRRETRVLLPETRFGRYAYLLDKWFLEDASVRTKLTTELTLPIAWKDLDYDEFQLAVSQMATDWLEQRICELENDFTKVIYDPDTVFQHQDVRNILLGSCKYGGARILQNIVRLLYKRKPVELRMVIQLDRKHFQIFQAILAHCRKHRESEKLREIVDEMNKVESEKASAYKAAESSDDDVPY